LPNTVTTVLSKSKISLERRAGQVDKHLQQSVVDAMHLLPDYVTSVV
jgi:hypothetical protein